VTPVRGVLVTGVEAPVGERLVRRLLDDPDIGHVIAVAPRPEKVALPESRRLTFLPVELNKERRVHDLLFGPARELGVEVVIHTAFVGSPTRDSLSAHALNVDATRALLALCERHPTIRRFVLRSFSEVYQIEADLPVLIAEDHPLNLHPGAPQFVRDRVEADLQACVRMGLSSLQIQVLRTAEVLAPGTGSQLFDYLESPICFRPMGFDPMLNVLSLSDVTSALHASVRATEQGVFNIPGADTLPLSLAVSKWGRPSIAVPGGLMTPLYRWRTRLWGGDFRYGMNRRRFHYSGVLDGRRARDVLGWQPSRSVEWPV
jgi:UDP-glucose 4-epimerase